MACHLHFKVALLRPLVDKVRTRIMGVELDTQAPLVCCNVFPVILSKHLGYCAMKCGFSPVSLHYIKKKNNKVFSNPIFRLKPKHLI